MRNNDKALRNVMEQLDVEGDGVAETLDEAAAAIAAEFGVDLSSPDQMYGFAFGVGAMFQAFQNNVPPLHEQAKIRLLGAACRQYVAITPAPQPAPAPESEPEPEPVDQGEE